MAVAELALRLVGPADVLGRRLVDAGLGEHRHEHVEQLRLLDRLRQTRRRRAGRAASAPPSDV